MSGACSNLTRLAAWGILAVTSVCAQTVTVTATVNIGGNSKIKPSPEGAVVWLQPMTPMARFAEPPTFTVVQKDKRFDPHVIVVPVGAHVAFPNFDPFFHNVFSMFDGKRFDLGLYEAGASRTVAFPRAGVCYIFCNIHPEMSAVVVVVDTPYYGMANKSGQVSIPNVVSGRYLLRFWHERAQKSTGDTPREVTVSPTNSNLGAITLVDSGQLNVTHKNKYGRDYDPSTNGPSYR